MKGIILHGGHGTRLRPLTHTGPKQLLPIANKPMSEYCLESIIETGIDEVAIIVGGVGSNKVREYYENGEKFGIKITYIEQNEPKGIAHAIKLCKDFVNDEKFLVFLGDNIIQKSIKEVVTNFQNSKYDSTILLCEVNNPERFGIAEVKNGKILKIIEKPKNPPSNLAVTGIYLLTPLIFDVIDNLKPSWRNELEITDALDILLKNNDNISYEIITDYWKDTGTPEDIINANTQILKNQSEKKLIEKSTVIESDSSIIMPCIIGKNCKIEKNSIIGPNASIGDNTIITSNVCIKNTIIMSNCKIEGGLKINNSIISANCHLHGNNKDNSEKLFLLGEGTRISLWDMNSFVILNTW